MHDLDVACMETGELVCFASDCCIRDKSGDKLFECFSHADRCHAGTGTYVILKSSMVFSAVLVFFSPCITCITCPLPLTYLPLPPSPRTKADVHGCMLARVCAGKLMSSTFLFIDSFICNGVFRSLFPGAGHSRDALVFMGLALSGCLRRGGPRSPPWTPSISQSVMTCKMMLCMLGLEGRASRPVCDGRDSREGKKSPPRTPSPSNR